jgi:exodeoxyribonuclease-3
MSSSLTVATWNVNGIRARLDRLMAWLERSQVDILCLQETKVQDEQFPFSSLEGLGYHIEVDGQKSFNGVAIFSRFPMKDVVKGLGDDPQKRLIGATIQDMRVYCAYFPNGQALDSDKFVYKMQWMGDLRGRLREELETYPQLLLLGDFNVAPEPRDTHDPERWEGGIHCSEQERTALAGIREVGLHDALRVDRPDDVVFTWWDYRTFAFPKNHGLRIDHIYVSEPLVGRVQGVEVDREERKGKQPSDHAPLMLRLGLG